MDSVRLVRLDGSLFFFAARFLCVLHWVSQIAIEKRSDEYQQHCALVLSFLITMMMKIFIVWMFLFGIPKYGVQGLA